MKVATIKTKEKILTFEKKIYIKNIRISFNYELTIKNINGKFFKEGKATAYIYKDNTYFDNFLFYEIDIYTMDRSYYREWYPLDYEDEYIFTFDSLKEIKNKLIENTNKILNKYSNGIDEEKFYKEKYS